MTTIDGDPLTGDPTGPDVRHLLAGISPRAPGMRPALVPPHPGTRARLAPPVPVIHEACGLGQCGGCSSRTCVSRRPGPVPVELAPARWYDGDHIDGNQS
jgi:hypothetical protein